MKKPKIAIVYDWFDKWGGAERMILTLTDMFPNTDIFTSYFDLQAASWARNLNVKTSFMQTLPRFITRNRVASLPFYPFAFESFDFSEYDLVISISSSFAKGVLTKSETRHICLMLAPTRFLWTYEKEYRINIPLIHTYINYLKKWDFVAAQRPDKIIAISKTVQKRIKKYYGRESEVIYPPFDFDYWKDLNEKLLMKNVKLKLKMKNYFLVVSRLEPYKKVDLVVKVFNNLPNKKLVVIGKGTKLHSLMSTVKQNITFLHDVSDEGLVFHYKNAKALIMPQEEDFGYTALEAQFFSLPVIAYARGGATETVINGITGIFFHEHTKKGLIRAIEKFEKEDYTLKNNLKKNIKHLEKFDKNVFKKKLLKNIDQILDSSILLRASAPE